VKYREGWAAYKFKAIFGDWPTADDRVPTEIEKPPRPELVSWIMGDKAKHAARLRRRNVVDIRQVAVYRGRDIHHGTDRSACALTHVFAAASAFTANAVTIGGRVEFMCRNY
jgi:hypothetical protein